MVWIRPTKREINEYYQDLDERRKLDDMEWNIIHYHYYRLGVVDNKTSSLLQYNGIVLATLAILVSSDRDEIIINTNYEVILFFVSLLFSFISVITLLNSVSLKWRIICERSSLEDLHDSLLKATIVRTKTYVRALWLSRVSGVALAVLFFLVVIRAGFLSLLINDLQKIIS